MNGWGVPALRNITSKDASEKYKVYLISPNETIMENDDCRIYALTNGYLKMIFDAGWGNALYQDPSDERLWELKCCFKNAKKEVILKHISKKQAKIKYAIEKIRPSEIIIDSDWTVVESQEVAYEIAKRIYWLTHNYLELIFDAGWEMLYIDPHDKRLWELTYPKSEMHGGGPPMLRYITEENAKIKYTIEIIKPIVGTSL
ncbi:hypothetical protein FACS18947_1060 [Bacteroidia bacterium]|nr:hypothetical protein FACS18947_1060 [Bacteroidia bacterium]